jgi:hypothetical protein
MSGMLRPLPLSEPFSAGDARGLPDLAAVLARQNGQKNMTIQITVFLASEKHSGHEPI